MKLTQLTEAFVINNDEFEDYLDRGTEQLKSELESGKNARDAVHDLARQFSDQHNKSHEAYERMTDSLFARLHKLELGQSEAPEMGMEPEMGSDAEMMQDPMGDMEMDTPGSEEMPSDSDMEDYAAVMDNEPEMEESVSEAKERPYICVHAKKGKYECHAGSSYEAAKKAAEHWKMKSTAGIDAHLADVEKVAENIDEATGNFAEPIYNLIDIDGEEAVLNELIRYLSGEQIEDFVADYKRNHDFDESTTDTTESATEVEEADTPYTIEDIKKMHEVTTLALKKTEGLSEEQLNEVLPLVGAAVGAVARAAGGAIAKKVAKKAAGAVAGSMAGSNTAESITLEDIKNINKITEVTLRNENLDENYAAAAGQAIKKVAGSKLATGAASMAKKVAGSKLGKAATLAKGAGIGGAVKKGLKGMGNALKGVGMNLPGVAEEADSIADRVMGSASRKVVSEYNDFYQALDGAAKAGKKAGDTIKVGGKTIKLKQDPKRMSDLTDAEMDKIDAMASRLNEYGKKKKY